MCVPETGSSALRLLFIIYLNIFLMFVDFADTTTIVTTTKAVTGEDRVCMHGVYARMGLCVVLL